MKKQLKKRWVFVINYNEFYEKTFDEAVTYKFAYKVVREQFSKKDVYKIEHATNYDEFTSTTTLS